MIYTAQCPKCKRVVIASKTFEPVRSWLSQGLIVTERDFDDDNPYVPFNCGHCPNNAGVIKDAR